MLLEILRWTVETLYFSHEKKTPGNKFSHYNFKLVFVSLILFMKITKLCISDENYKTVKQWNLEH